MMILKDFEKDVTIQKPKDYNREEFICSYNSSECLNSEQKLWPKENLISYGRLPNGKVMINWPIHGNDYYVNSIEMDEQNRSFHFQKAKEKSLRFLKHQRLSISLETMTIL